jgi:hypothetical protein
VRAPAQQPVLNLKAVGDADGFFYGMKGSEFCRNSAELRT